MADAGIDARVTPVRSGEAELSRITGARTPSGVPVVITAPAVERPRRTSSPARGRRGRAGQSRPVVTAVRRRTPGRPDLDSAA